MAEHAYSRLRSEFGRQCNFVDGPPEIRVNIQPNEDELLNFIRRNPIDRGTNITTNFSDHYVNTPYLESAIQGINHAEGGWPKDVSYADTEQTARHRKKIEKEEFFQSQLLNVCSVMEHGILQNNGIDIYNTFFQDCKLLSAADMEPAKVKIICTFKDPTSIKRPVSSISWHPEGPDRIAMAHCSLKFQQHTKDTSLECYVFRTEDLSKPESVMTSNFPICSLRYSMKDTNIIAGGQYNGQAAFWDLRKGSRPVERSTLSFSHKDPAYEVTWVQSKSGTEFFTASTDGQVLWWDIRKIAQPVDQLWIDATRKLQRETAEGGTCLDFEFTMPTKFLVGTETGNAFICNRKGKTGTERISAVYETHIGPLKAIQRNPTWPKYFMTVGDWTMKIVCGGREEHLYEYRLPTVQKVIKSCTCLGRMNWLKKEGMLASFLKFPISVHGDSRKRLLVSHKKSMHYSSDACWSTTRPSVFFISKMNGCLEVWDLMFRQKGPTLNVMVSEDPLLTVEPDPHGVFVAVGSERGNTTILKLSKNLIEGLAIEKNLFLQVMERETRREKIMEAKEREKKLQQRARPSLLVAEIALYEKEVEKAIVESEEYFFDFISKEQTRLQRDTLNVRGVSQPTTEPKKTSIEEESPAEHQETNKKQDSGAKKESRQDGEHADEPNPVDDSLEHDAP